MGDRFLIGPRPGTDAAVTTVVADARHRCTVDHGCVVDVMNLGDVHVVDSAVIKEAPVVPTPALIAFTEISEAIVDAAIEPHLRRPEAVVEGERLAAPGPVPGSPKQTRFRWQHPCTGHPKVIVRIVGPVAWCPEITISPNDAADTTMAQSIRIIERCRFLIIPALLGR